MLKFKISALDDVDDAFRGHYVKSDDGFQLAVEGLDGPAALMNALSMERDERKKSKERAQTLEGQLRETQDELRNATQENARNVTDVRSLEDGWKRKHEQEVTELKASLAAKDAEYKPVVERLRAGLTSIKVDAEATRIASEIAMPGCASVLIPHIKQRLMMTEQDGHFATVVLDKAGKPTDMTLKQFKAAFSSEAEFAPVITGSKASGGGAAGVQRGGTTNAKTKSRADFDALSFPDREQFLRGGGTIQ